MGFLKRISSFWRGEAQVEETDVLWLVVECDKCNETIRVRINKKTDLQNEFLRPGEAGCAFTLKKEVLGKRCSNLMEVCLKFDPRCNIISKRLRTEG